MTPPSSPLASKLALLLAVLLLSAGTIFSFWTYRQIALTAAAQQHAVASFTAGVEFLSALKDAETGQRGYLLTGNEAFLQPYLAVRDGLPEQLAELQRLAAADSASLPLVGLAPLVAAKMAELEQVIDLRRAHKDAELLEIVNGASGKHLMDAIRLQMQAFLQAEEAALARHAAEHQATLRTMFTLIVGASALALLVALGFAWLVYRQGLQRKQEWLHRETQHLLAQQGVLNQQLQESNRTLQLSEEQLAVTLSSIGDGVITTDAQSCVTSLNPLAEQLTGWPLELARGQKIEAILKIVNKSTRLSVVNPVMDALLHGTVQGLANHTVLLARDGREYDIADSCAPIRARDGLVIGAVLVFRDVTEEYAVQQAVRDSAVQMQTILSTVVDGILTLEEKGSVLHTVNPSIEKMFGYTAAEMVGQDIRFLIPGFDSPLTAVSALEVQGRRKDGSLFALELSLNAMWLGGACHYAGVLRDLTVRKQAQDALLQAGALQAAIFNSANFSSIATDAKGVIQIFNVGAERMLGYAAADVVDKITPAEISDPLELVARARALSAELDTHITPGFEALVFKASRGIEDIYELTYVRQDGSRLPAVVSVTALRDAQDSIIGYLLIGTDNTARQQIEAERQEIARALQERTVELEAARSLAEKANLAKSDFLSSMSHELRSPLNAILGFAQLMESDTPAPSKGQQDSIGQILRAGWHLLKLINEILDLTKIESRQIPLSNEPVLLGGILSECRSMLEPQAQQRGITLLFSTDAPVYVLADHTRLKQVFINLLTNAIKYNRPQGTVEVRCSLQPKGRMRVSIRDTGQGLRPDQKAQLFQAFNRLGQEAGGIEGTGIGLVVAKQLVELMDGSIGAESQPGVGSVFWVELRIVDAPMLPAHSDAALALPALAGAEQSRSLLYVEDNPANMTLVQKIMERHPAIQLLTATNGLKGIEMARAHVPDVILLDINLPGINGFETLKLLREDPLTAHIPALAISANAMQSDIQKGREAGFLHYLTKPIRVDEFMQALHAALEFAQRHKG